MSTLNDRPNTALLVIDMQQGVVADAYRPAEVIGTIAALVERARAAEVAVVWVQHGDDGLPRGSREWQYVPELARNDGEPLVHKSYGDSFEATDLESVLAAGRIGSLFVTGAHTDACVRATLHGAIARGYDATLVADAHTTGDHSAYGAPPPDKVIAHTNLYWRFHEAPGRSAGTVEAAGVEFAANHAPA